MRVKVKIDRDGAVLAYEAPDDTPIGARVLVPLPWFLDNNSGWIEYPAHAMPGTITGPSDYSGPTRRIVRVIE